MRSLRHAGRPDRTRTSLSRPPASAQRRHRAGRHCRPRRRRARATAPAPRAKRNQFPAPNRQAATRHDQLHARARTIHHPRTHPHRRARVPGRLPRPRHQRPHPALAGQRRPRRPGLGHHGRAWRPRAAKLDRHHRHLSHDALQPRRRCPGLRFVERPLSRPRLPRCRLRRGAQRKSRHRRVAEMAGAMGPADRSNRHHSLRSGPGRRSPTTAPTTPSMRNSGTRRARRSRC